MMTNLLKGFVEPLVKLETIYELYTIPADNSFFFTNLAIRTQFWRRHTPLDSDLKSSN